MQQKAINTGGEEFAEEVEASKEQKGDKEE